MHTVELPTYRFNYKLDVLFSCKYCSWFSAVFGALLYARSYLLKYYTSYFKTADHVLPVFPIRIISKSRQLIVIKAAAAATALF